MNSVVNYKPEDFKYLQKYFSIDFLERVSISDLLDVMNEKIMLVGFDEKWFYNAEGHKLQEIYDNICDMN